MNTEKHSLVFLCIPENYDLEIQIRKGVRRIPWLATRHHKYMLEGVTVFLWQGKQGPKERESYYGLHAVAKIVEPPRFWTANELDTYGVPAIDRRLDDKRCLIEIVDFAPHELHLKKDQIQSLWPFEGKFLPFSQTANVLLSEGKTAALVEILRENTDWFTTLDVPEKSENMSDNENEFDVTARQTLNEEANSLRSKSQAELLSIIAKLGRERSRSSLPGPTKVAGYQRDPAIVAYALNRALDTCELHDCTNPLFRRDDGTAYVEVHHIQPLGEKGQDSVENVACLCPNHHREAHHGEFVKRVEIKNNLQSLRASG